MRIGVGAIHRGVGDFVSGKFAVPQNPVTAGMGFVRGRFSVPQNPVGLYGLGRLSGCGDGCTCGPCRSGGMGAIDLSLTGTGIASSISPTLTIPNYLIYAGVAAVAYFAMSGRRRR